MYILVVGADLTERLYRNLTQMKHVYKFLECSDTQRNKVTWVYFNESWFTYFLYVQNSYTLYENFTVKYNFTTYPIQ